MTLSLQVDTEPLKKAERQRVALRALPSSSRAVGPLRWSRTQTGGRVEILELIALFSGVFLLISL